MKNKSLVIVESPAKAKTINKYLGKEFEVMASVGHIKDLPKSKFGVKIEEDFHPEYSIIKGKGKIVKAIREAAKRSESVYLAPDPDREGEAIAWHIAQELPLPEDRIFRVAFNEITAGALKKAFKTPGRLDHNKVDAQQARRILDRIVGYSLSPILWRNVKKGLSAGRVQSVALRLVCEREGEITSFKSREYWTLNADLEKAGNPTFRARLEKIGGKKAEIGTAAEAAALVGKLKKEDYIVRKVSTKEKQKRPGAPFITSQLQQEAYRRLGFTAKKTMSLAQRLYEGVELPGEGHVALITYMRTDSPRVAGEAQREALAYIGREFGSQYVPGKPNFYKPKKKSRAQDAHECIRPTSVARHPDKVRKSLDRDLARLYDLIWSRFLASQMTSARFREITVEIEADDCTFRARGLTMLFDGHLRALAEIAPREEDKEKTNGEEVPSTVLPPLSEGDRLELIGLEDKQNFTQPPPRYTEATLIKAMEEKGIGRPSTYATILTTIQTRDYTEKKKGRLHPTELGMLVNKLLVKHFPEVFDIEFTATMEDQLDLIEEGQRNWVETLREFYGPFKDHLERASREMKNVKKEVEPTDLACEKCGRQMVIRWGRNGRFLACSGYPECKNTKNFNRTGENRIEVVKTETTEIMCEKCGQPMIIRKGRFGRFLACSGYPKCKNAKPLNSEELPCPCPGCDGKLLPKMSRRRRRFFGCSRYPDCNFASWDVPRAHPCPECGSPVTMVKKGAEDVLYCPRPECQAEFPAADGAGAEK